MSAKLRKKAHFYEPIFGSNLFFVQDRKEYEEIALDFGFTIDTENYKGVCWGMEDISKNIIGVFDGKTSTLMHECIHAALRIMEHVGQKLYYGDECLPYLAEFIFTQCMKKWKND